LIASIHTLSSGDVISLSDGVTLVFHANARTSNRRPILDLDAFRLRLEEELERFVRFQRPVTVLSLRFAKDPESSSVLTTLAGRTRLLDSVSWGSRRELLIIFPELARAEVITTAQSIVDALKTLELEVSAGFASCPEDGLDVDALRAGARAASECPIGQVAPASDAVT